jgi:hypothetical protein
MATYEETNTPASIQFRWIQTIVNATVRLPLLPNTSLAIVFDDIHTKMLDPQFHGPQ